MDGVPNENCLLCWLPAALHTHCRYLWLCLHTTVNISILQPLPSWLSHFPPSLPFFPLHISLSLLTLFFYLPFIPLTSCAVSCFSFYPSISAIIAFHPAEYGDGNNLTLLMQLISSAVINWSPLRQRVKGGVDLPFHTHWQATHYIVL